MKAIVKTDQKAGSFAVKDIPVPKPKAMEVLIQIKATGLCYTDMSILNGQYKGRKPVPIPMIMGHEGAGIIAEVGAEVSTLEVGQRVGFEALGGCGRCYNCRTGNKNMCTDWNHIGITYDGTFAEYMVIPESLLHVLPDDVEFADAALLEPLGLVVRSIEHIQPVIGESAVIVGPGTVGLLHLQALIAAGVSKLIVVGLDVDKFRFGIAEKLGATHIVNGSKEDPVDAVLNITDGLGADIVVETASSPKVWDFLLDIVAAKGRISPFGLYPESGFKPLALIRKGVTIYGDVAFLQRHFIRAIRWLESGKVSGQALVTKRFSLDQAQEAFDAFKHKETVKCLFEL
ncbi:MAG: alcohol dehydrogenase catalytic domain-containing protein [Spirochaetaceae bacterium]|nr:MAG: alcohol dehydrogenase catalytic domain-containing protein [Spirochaetaceae bacterium]